MEALMWFSLSSGIFLFLFLRPVKWYITFKGVTASMKYVRFSLEDGTVHYGALEGEKISEITNPFVGDVREKGDFFSLDAVHLLSPCQPSKALCIGLNYRDHARECHYDIPRSPVVFMKPSTAVIGPGDVIVYPQTSRRVDYEAELCVVIAKEAKNVPEEDAFSYVLGYTCANDVTARDLQPHDGQWTIAKGFDTFLPLGPYISDEVNPLSLSIESRLNGKTMQKSNTSNLIFDVKYLVSYLSSVMTLLPGDVICTGTPSGISGMNRGDTIEIVIEGLGELRNIVG